MKLYYCSGINIDMNFHEHIIANSEKEAEDIFRSVCEELELEHSGVFVKEVKVNDDECEMIIRPKRHYANGSNYFN
jgi:hypothetical protein